MSVILILAGLWALVLGRISISRRLVLRGKFARYFGLTLLASTLPVTFLLLMFFSFIPLENFRQIPGFESGVSLVCSILISVLFAIPFFKWQTAVMEGRTELAWIPKVVWATVVFSFIFAEYRFSQLYLSFTGRGSGSPANFVSIYSKSTIEGESFGKGKTVEECIREGSLKFQIVPEGDSEKVFDAKTAGVGFLSGCTKASRDLSEWCTGVRPGFDDEWAEERCLSISPTQPVELNGCRQAYLSARNNCILNLPATSPSK